MFVIFMSMNESTRYLYSDYYNISVYSTQGKDKYYYKLPRVFLIENNFFAVSSLLLSPRMIQSASLSLKY